MKYLLFSVLIFVTVASSGQVLLEKTPFPGLERDDAVAHYYQGKIYCGTGFSQGFFTLKDWWYFDVKLDTWQRLDDAPFSPRQYVTSFQWRNYIYMLGGWQDNQRFFNEFWRFDCDTHIWEQQQSLPSNARWAGAGLVLNDRLYTGLGQDSSQYFNDWWEYDPALDEWIEKASFPGGLRSKMISSSINGMGLVGLGQNDSIRFNDFWIYNALSNTWKKAGFELQDSVSYANHAVLGNSIVLISGDLREGVSPNWFQLSFDNALKLIGGGELIKRGRGNLVSDGMGSMYLLWGLDSNFRRVNSLFEIEFSKEENNLSVEAFPNPCADLALIRYNGEPTNLKVYDCYGKKIGEHTLSSPTNDFFNFGTYPSGIYYLKACEGNSCSETYSLMKL